MFGLISRQKEWDKSKPVNFFFFNVFNSLLTQCTRSIRRHRERGKTKKNNKKNWFLYFIVFQKPKILQNKSCIYINVWTLPDKEISYSKLLFWLCLLLSKLFVTPRITRRSKSYRCLLIGQSPNSLTTVARAARYKPKKEQAHLFGIQVSYVLSGQFWLLNRNPN